MAAAGLKLEQKHGKSGVRVCRVWRGGEGGRELIVEWNVSISLSSDCIPAYVDGDNSSIVATDTMKNTVYVKAKECSEYLSVEDFAILLGRHFTSFYPQVTATLIKIVEKPWERVVVDGLPHNHGFKLGSEKHITEVTVMKGGALSVASGIEGLALLKTTKSGFEGFVRDQFTLLPETRERMMATNVSASWRSLQMVINIGNAADVLVSAPMLLNMRRYSFERLSSIPGNLRYFVERYQDLKKVLMDTFFGPPEEGVYSPSVQNTLNLMANAVLSRFPDIESIKLTMPNLHFLPVNMPSKDNPSMVKFNDDVYTPTDEPHGTIEATLSRVRSKM